MIFRRDISKIIARNWMFAATTNERKLLSRWRNRSEQNEAGYKVMKRWWQLAGSVPKKESLVEQVPVDEFFLRTRLLKIGRRSATGWKVAASIAVLVALTSVLFQLMYPGGANRVELMANAGHQTEAVLPDGSHVWLNSSSKLVYEQQFGRVRALNLEGEAFFSVSPDRTSPFIVNAGGLKVRATGTQFNVRNYADEATIETTLTEGGVNIKTPAGVAAKMIPGESIAFDKSSGKLVRLNVRPDDNIAWKDGILVFHNASFANLITRLERRYAIRIVYDPESFQDIHYSGTIRNLRLDQVFDFINLTVPIKVEMNENSVSLFLKEKSKAKNKLPMNQ